MTNKDYKAIARSINGSTVLMPPLNLSLTDNEKDVWITGSKDQLRQIAMDLCEVMHRDNPRFDRERFLKACGIE